MPTDQEIVQTFKKRFNREPTPTDFANARKGGLESIEKSYQTITGGTKTANQAGAQAYASASTGEAPQQLDANTELEAMTAQQGTFDKILGEALRAKQQQVQPIDQKVMKINEAMGKLDIRKYMDLSPEAALSAINDDYARLKARKDYFQKQADDDSLQLDNILTAAQNIYGSKLSALGLKVQREDQQRAEAFSQAALLSGVMPPGVPPEYQDAWRAQSNALIAASRPRGGGGMPQGEKDERAFRSDVVQGIQALDSGKAGWGTVWDSLHTMYPTKSNAELDQALGGGYDDAKGGWWGRSTNTTNSGVTDEQVWAQISALSPEDQADSAYVSSQIMALGKDPADFGY